MGIEKLAPTIASPAYVIDEAALLRNLALLKQVKEAAGCKIIFAQKAYACFETYKLMAEYLDGTTASGIYEARLGKEHFGKEVHVYSPAFDAAEIKALLPIATHVTFNSLEQWKHYKPQMTDISCGLRLNPELSITGTDLYNPCIPGSRLGIPSTTLKGADLRGIKGLHFHILCENNHDASAKLIDTVAEKYAELLPHMEWVNFGGGHFITHPEYQPQVLIDAIKRFRARYPQLEVILEPGGAVVLNAGYLVAEVLDIVQNEKSIAILDTSATAHMPDVLEMPYRPNVLGAGEAGEKAHSYEFAGRTCLAGDIIADYSFDAPLQIGDRVVFCDMAQYSMVKNTMFNGIPSPDIGILDSKGSYRILRQFTYDDFKSRNG
ncbi:MAG: carboxynorspermidine decarboxylase [Alphaproteobacteria bacterium]|nr:carboxynorspermidine decarboxylase [Alphaproteobacteria bacterium]